MATSALKSILQMKEMPFPSLLLITDEVNATAAEPLTYFLLDKLIAEKCYSIHCVHGSPFSEPWSNSDKVTHHKRVFENYGEDPTALDNFMSYYRSNHSRKTQNNILHQSKEASNVIEPNENTCVLNSKNLESGSKNTSDIPESALKTLVLVDRVEDILLYSSVRHVLLCCREVTEDGGIVILTCSSDIVEPPALQHMKYVASSIIALAGIERLPEMSHWLGIADVFIRRPSGKIIKSREYYQIDLKAQTISTAVAPAQSSHSLDAVPDVQLATEGTKAINNSSFARNPALGNRSEILGGDKGAPKISLKSTESATDVGNGAGQLAKISDKTDEGDGEEKAINALVSQATFNLKLSDEERKAKNNLLLPHQRVQQSGPGGVVHYTPDSEDWDEEDPDDDLDI